MTPLRSAYQTEISGSETADWQIDHASLPLFVLLFVSARDNLQPSVSLQNALEREFFFRCKTSAKDVSCSLLNADWFSASHNSRCTGAWRALAALLSLPKHVACDTPVNTTVFHVRNEKTVVNGYISCVELLSCVFVLKEQVSVEFPVWLREECYLLVSTTQWKILFWTRGQYMYRAKKRKCTTHSATLAGFIEWSSKKWWNPTSVQLFCFSIVVLCDFCKKMA